LVRGAGGRARPRPARLEAGPVVPLGDTLREEAPADLFALLEAKESTRVNELGLAWHRPRRFDLSARPLHIAAEGNPSSSAACFNVACALSRQGLLGEASAELIALRAYATAARWLESATRARTSARSGTAPVDGECSRSASHPGSCKGAKRSRRVCRRPWRFALYHDFVNDVGNHGMFEKSDVVVARDYSLVGAGTAYDDSLFRQHYYVRDGELYSL
jgi:hypothetical protein